MSTARSYRPDIDGLRAVAVFSVLIFHFFPEALPGGFVGVDIFFVISGYLITGIILRNLDEGRFSFKEFYGRRIRRIFPALLTVLSTVGVAAWFLLLPNEFIELGKHALAAAAFVSNFLLWSETGYFDPNAHSKILLHLWSLAIEEQFYVVWPAALVVLHRFKVRPAVSIGVSTVVSLAICLALTKTDPTQAFYAPWSRAWELLAGAALTVTERSKLVRGLVPVAGLLGLALIATALVAFKGTDPFPSWRAILPVAGAALLILSGPSSFSGRLLSLKPLPWVGLISYPLYLWHWPLVAFPYIVEGATPSMQARAIAMIASVCLAAATYVLIERPIRHRQSTFPLATGLAAMALASVGVVWSQGIPQRPNITPYLSAEATYLEATAWPYKENDNCLSRFPSPDRQEGWWFCMLEQDAPPTIFLMGNSFANHLYPGLAQSPLLANENVLQFGTCDPAMGIRYSLYDVAHPCYGDRRDRLEEFTSNIVLQNPSIKTVILSAAWPYFNVTGDTRHPNDAEKTDGVYSTVGRDGGETSYEAFMGGLERRIQFLTDHEVTPIIVLSTPTFPYYPDTCFAARPFRQAVNSCSISLKEEMDRQAVLRNGIADIQMRHPKLLVFDPLPSLCQNGLCDLIKDGRPLLRDIGHLSIEGSAIVGAELSNFLVRARDQDQKDLEGASL